MFLYTYSLQNGRDELVRKSDQQTKSAVTKVITLTRVRLINLRLVLLKEKFSVEKGAITI
jgi:hypothetical protein